RDPGRAGRLRGPRPDHRRPGPAAGEEGAGMATRAARLAGLDSAPGGPAARVRGLSRAFGGRLVLDGVDLDIEPGEFVAMLAVRPSGRRWPGPWSASPACSCWTSRSAHSTR